MLKKRAPLVIIFLLMLTRLTCGLEDKGLWKLDLNPFSAAAIFYLRQENRATCIPVSKSSSIARLLLNRKHFLFMAYLVLSPDMAGLLNDSEVVDLCNMGDEALWAGLSGFPDLEITPEDREAVCRSSNAVFSRFKDASKAVWRQRNLFVADRTDFNGAHFKMIIRKVIADLNAPFIQSKNMRKDFLEFLEFWKQGFCEAALLEWGRWNPHGAEIINDIFTSYSTATRDCDRLKLLKDCFCKFEQLECKVQVRSRLKELFALFVQADSLILGLPQKEVVIIPSANIEANFKLYVCFKEDVLRKLKASSLIIKKKEQRRSVKGYLQTREREKVSKKPLFLEANNLLLESVALEECFAILSYDREIRMDYKYKPCSNQTKEFVPMNSPCLSATRDLLGQAGYLFYDAVLEGALAQEISNIPAMLTSEGSEATLCFIRHLFDLNDYEE